MCLILFILGNYALHSQCASTSLTFGTAVTNSDEVEIPVILNNPPADIESMTITIEFSNDTEVILDDASTSASLHSTLSGFNYNFNYTNTATTKKVVLSAVHFNNFLNFSSGSPVLFTLHFSVRAGFCSEVSFPDGASPNRISFDGGDCNPSITDTEEFCPSSYTISGLIESEGGLTCNGSINDGVPDATVSVENSVTNIFSDEDDTSSNGTYFIDKGIASGKNYKIEPVKDDNLDCGLTSFDVALVHNHIQFKDKLTTPSMRIAGDGNNNGTISTYDKYVMNNTILMNSGNKIFQSWTFVPSGTFATMANPQPQNVVVPSYTPHILVSNVTQSLSQKDFVGIKVGDVNGSCTECSTLRSPSELDLKVILVDNVTANLGEEVLIPVRALDFNRQTVLSMEMQLSTEYLELIDLVGADLPEFGTDYFTLNQRAEGHIDLLWSPDEQAYVSLNPTDILFYIKVKTKRFIPTLEGLINLAYHRDDNRLHHVELENEANLKLLVNTVTSNPTSIINTHAVYPNPVNSQSVLILDLETESTLSIDFLNATGKVIASIQRNFVKGYNELSLPINKFNDKLIFYQISSNQEVISGKIIKLD